MNKHLQTTSALLALLLAATVSLPATAVPVTTFIGFYTDRYAPNSVPNFATPTEGNHVQWDVQLISGDPSRSNAFSRVATTVPEPGSLALAVFALTAIVVGSRWRGSN